MKQPFWYLIAFAISFAIGWFWPWNSSDQGTKQPEAKFDPAERTGNRTMWSLSNGLQEHKQLIVVATCPTCVKYDMPNQATVRTLDSVYYTICCSEANTVAAFNIGDTIR